jgi:acetyl-CoA carboxylase carboxyltransferase component
MSLASSLGVDEVVDPRDLRNALLRGLSMSALRRTALREAFD